MSTGTFAQLKAQTLVEWHSEKNKFAANLLKCAPGRIRTADHLVRSGTFGRKRPSMAHGLAYSKISYVISPTGLLLLNYSGLWGISCAECAFFDTVDADVYVKCGPRG